MFDGYLKQSHIISALLVEVYDFKKIIKQHETVAELPEYPEIG